MLTTLPAASASPSVREQAFWRVFHHMASVIEELETDVVRYRELCQLALAQQHELERENYRLRSSRAAQGEIERRSVER